MSKKKNQTPKSQRKISIDQQTPYDKVRGNPNVEDNTKRGDQFSFKGDTTKPFKIGLEDIDESIIYYFQNIIKPFVIQNENRIPVPIIYGSPEIWKSYQKDGYYRDKNGKIMAPLIMFKKEDIVKNRSIGNKLDANHPNNFGVFQKRYSQKNAYDNFSLLTNRIPDKTYYVSVIPDYLDIEYSCVIFTYRVDQLNKIIEAIEYASDSYWGDPERFKFNTRIDSFRTINEISTGNERIVKSTFNIKLKGYIIPDLVQKDITIPKKLNEKSQVVFGIETELKAEEPLTSRKPTSFIEIPRIPNIIYNITQSGGGGGTGSSVVLNSIGTQILYNLVAGQSQSLGNVNISYFNIGGTTSNWGEYSILSLSGSVLILTSSHYIPTYSAYLSNGTTIYDKKDISNPNLILPKVYITNSLGTLVNSHEINQTGSAPDAYISNSNGTYIILVPSGVTSSIPDTYISNSNGTYIKLIPSATSASIENVRINVSGTISYSIDFNYFPSSSQIIGTIYATQSYGTGLVTNSNGTVQVSVLSGQTGSFPNTYISNSNGSYTASIPSATSASIPDTYISNSDGTYKTSITSAISFSLPNIQITNIGASYITQYPSVKNYVIENVLIRIPGVDPITATYFPSSSATVTYTVTGALAVNSGSTVSITIASTQTGSFPNTYISNSNGTYVVSIASGTSSSIPNTYISNSNGTYTASIPSAGSSSIPDTYLSNSNGTYNTSVPSATSASIINTYLQNNTSSATWSASIASAVTYSLSSSIIKNPDGTDEIALYKPSSSGYIYDATSKKSGIVYKQDAWTGELINFGTGSEGYNWSQGIYDQTYPVYPLNYASLNRTASNAFVTLISNNTASNLNRFTDLNGGQTYSDNLVIDHISGWMWYRISASNTVWATAISAAEASTQGGYTNWHLPTEKQLEQIINYSSSLGLGYAPFNIKVGSFWTCTTFPLVTQSARLYATPSSSVINSNKSNNMSYILIRKHL